MLIRVYVTANAKQARVVKISEDYFEAWVDERAVGRPSEQETSEILAEHFKVPKIENLNRKRSKVKRQDGPSIPWAHR